MLISYLSMSVSQPFGEEILKYWPEDNKIKGVLKL